MKLTELRPILRTNEFDGTIDFYTKKLGFICGERNDDWGWAVMCLDEVEIMIVKPNTHTPFEKPVFTGSFYIRTNDVEGWWKKLKDKTTVCYPIETFEWGMREFAIYDNNGYQLQFGQEIE